MTTEAQIKEDISELREDLQWDKIYGQIEAMGYPSKIVGYECLICHFKIYAKLFRRHVDYRRLKGAMVNHVKTHFITSLEH